MNQLFPLMAKEFGQLLNLQTRLRALYDGGYLSRPPGQDLRPTKRRGGQANIYALGTKGAAELRSQGMDIPRTDFDVKAKELKPLSFDHLLATGEAVAHFLLAFRSCSRIELLDVLPDGKFTSSVTVPIRGRRVRIPIKPDATFLVREDKTRTAFFLEVDLETMPNTRSAYEQSSFLRKAVGYLAYYREGLVKDDLDVETFVVLTVTNTAKHAEDLRLTTHRADSEGRGSDLFWFTTFKELLTSEPTAPLTGEIWKTATGESGTLV